MKIAVACDGLTISPYFVQTTSYTVYNVERGVIVGSNNLPALDQTISQLAVFLRSIGVDAFIVGRIDADMADVLRTSGAELIVDAQDDPLIAAKEYLSRIFTAVEV